jgi:hypothetical protein
MVFGVVEYLYLPTEFRDYGRGFVLLPAGDWTVRVEIPDSAMTVVGDEAPAMLLAGIEVSTTPRVPREVPGTRRVNVPVLTLAPPFRWASDTEGPVQMEVSTAEFVVRRGCGVSALSCGGTRGIQVMARATPATPGDGQVVSIESWDVPRPAADGFYLDPGPLGLRSEFHLIWTGREMIVWGGRSSGNYQEGPLTGGAAFDPVTSEWRVLPEPPLVGPDLTAVVWADDRMIMISRQATLAFDPDSDEWTRLGDGPPYVARSPSMTVWTGELVATWAPLGIHVFDPDVGLWTTLPDPGFNPIAWGGALRVIDGRLFAIGSYCQRVAEWMGTNWRPLPERSNILGPPEFCPAATRSGVAGGRLILWGDDEDWAAAYDPSTDSWSPIASPPHPLGEGWETGSVDIGGRLLVPVGQYAHYDESGQLVDVHPTIYDVATDRWLPVELPGPAGMQIVWTGEEGLSWGGCCWSGVVDAWRWRPPEG